MSNVKISNKFIKAILFFTLLMSAFLTSCTDNSDSSKDNKTDNADDVFQSSFSVSENQSTSDDNVSQDIGDAYTTKVDSSYSDESASQSEFSESESFENPNNFSNDIYDDWDNDVSQPNADSQVSEPLDNNSSAVTSESQTTDVESETESVSTSHSESESASSQSPSSSDDDGWTEFY